MIHICGKLVAGAGGKMVKAPLGWSSSKPKASSLEHAPWVVSTAAFYRIPLGPDIYPHATGGFFISQLLAFFHLELFLLVSGR